MQFICVYTDPVNQSMTYKAVITCDSMDIVEGSEIEGEYLLGFFKDKKLIFAIHNYRVVEAYAPEHVDIESVDKKSLNNKRANFKVLT